MVNASALFGGGGSPFVVPGSSNFTGGAPNTWIIDPVANVNGAKITSLTIYKHSVSFGPNTSTLTPFFSAAAGAAVSFQNIELPAGQGLRGVTQGTSGFVDASFDIL